jgi:hypothetical protein
MSLWMVIVLLGLVKLPVAALMLWLPFRNDQAMNIEAVGPETDVSGDSEDGGGGGSIALGASPVDPHPRSPLPRPRRRGPHGSGAPSAPRRIRLPTVAARLGRTATPGR